MVDETTYGRSPVVVVELIQPRCTNRFGASPCTATGTPKCYNCYWTCLDRQNYNADGSITWRLTRPNDNVGWLYEETDANNIKTNAIPILVNASLINSRINPGAIRKNESPLGRRSSATITLSDGAWDDHVGDFYLADRTPPETPAGFMQLLMARNEFFPGWQAKIYTGYEGQTLAQMEVRLFDVEKIEGPKRGQYTITCRDPLDQLRNAKYPPISRINTTRRVRVADTTIEVACLETQLSLQLGTDTGRYYAVLGSEIISYTGWTGTEPEFTLTGVRRGEFATAAAEHQADIAVQRAAYHQNERNYDVARYIIKEHTPVGAGLIDDAVWDDEGGTYLSTFFVDTVIPEPMESEKLIGELARDGLFMLWWEEREQKILMKAVRPPKEAPRVFTRDSSLLDLTSETKLDDRLTRVTTYYGVRDWLESEEEITNFTNRRTRIDAEVENPTAADDKIFEKVIYSRWTTTEVGALLTGASILLRYRFPPRYVTIDLDAKDRATKIGEVIDLVTPDIRDSEGNSATTRWEVIGIEETSPGSKVRATLQSYTFIGKFAIIMANDAPDYATATADERLNGCWFADETTGLMPDGSEPYLFQ